MLSFVKIISQTISEQYVVPVDDSIFETGSLRRKSNIRPNRIVTVNSNIILYRIGHLKQDKIEEVIKKLDKF